MTAFTVERQVRTTRERAFDAMADARNEVQWNGQVSASDLVTGAPVGQGTKFRTVNRGQPYDATITDYERPRRLQFDVTGKPLDIVTTFEFHDAGGAGVTTVRGSFDFRPKGAFRLLFPLMRPMIARDLPKQLASFAEFVETPESVSD